ncbi:MAG: hypothetical protein FWF44_07635, partial [Defluviitaleaceae bacterium]|nr:hypothetical protein [Defluviitaleaceae bacterium]
IVILTNGYMTGAELEKELFAAGIQIEMSGQGHALAMTSAADTPEGFGRLVDALLDIDKRREAGAPRRAGEVAPPPPLPRTALKYTPRQALRMKTERVSLSAGYGRASAEFIMPYPPGVPILAPGEVIDPAALGGYLDGYGEISVICD